MPHEISIGLNFECRIIGGNLFEIILNTDWPDCVAGDDKFIYWLRDCREAGLQVSLTQVKSKVTEILSSHGQADVEKTCKWFLLWHNRWADREQNRQTTWKSNWNIDQQPESAIMLSRPADDGIICKIHDLSEEKKTSLFFYWKFANPTSEFLWPY